MAQPPYRRIADEIRARIVDGHLRPGEPVPSARGITREWGVALATATKVLATLNAEGVTRSLPGRGTVVVSGPAVPARPADVAARAARRSEGDPDLTRERIVAAAVRVADAEGLAQLSMRRIATELGAAPMSLYRHVEGKDGLLVSMMDSVLGEDPLPARPPKGWRAQLELTSRLQWRAFRRHPWLAPALSITRPQLIPNGMRHTEWALRVLDTLGLTIQESMYIHTTLFSHIRGLALNLEAEAQAEQDSGLTSDEWMQTQEHGFRVIADTGEFPLLNRLVDSDMELDLDQLFEFGLGRLLDGLERHLAER
ncbi:TetR/AcrR family transcriptional regulator C-terminal domain-containing protein [Rugosimonospora africana]|uniref:GntR family transcriptional regulator n=1 Tax=Rugosimonospora africana TaxID=556532 RepID=A0A8J3QYX1_9ACTN|nr:TetR/AcrR family transcriptional regulator C-terminal domain-containing protein [Rugosimonospora africana]GIH19443.1 GntR family transcriptional regulator [Rugosimonospora africana]